MSGGAPAQARRVARLKGEERCVQCGAELVFPGILVRCFRCREMGRRRSRARRRAARYQASHTVAGLCRICPRPRVNAQHCEVHRDAHAEAERRRRKAVVRS